VQTAEANPSNLLQDGGSEIAALPSCFGEKSRSKEQVRTQGMLLGAGYLVLGRAGKTPIFNDVAEGTEVWRHLFAGSTR
jgi:hypothetical protein